VVPPYLLQFRHWHFFASQITIEQVLIPCVAELDHDVLDLRLEPFVPNQLGDELTLSSSPCDSLRATTGKWSNAATIASIACLGCGSARIVSSD
jgi:hypothetical protein